MGGTVIETELERLHREGMFQDEAKMLIEMGQEYGLDNTDILQRLQEKIGLSLEAATAYLTQYGKQLV